MYKPLRCQHCGIEGSTNPDHRRNIAAAHILKYPSGNVLCRTCFFKTQVRTTNREDVLPPSRPLVEILSGSVEILEDIRRIR